jgi:hypothetical protein
VSLPISHSFPTLASRFSTVRPWAQAAFGNFNRCTICMSYTLRLTPSAGDKSLADLDGVKEALAKAPPLPGAPAGSIAAQLFIRAAEFLPRVQRAFGPADVEGIGRDVGPGLVGKKGVVYIENCYPTAGDKRWSIQGLYERTTGDHWDLFDGFQMISVGEGLRNNSHNGKLWFWKAA